MVASQPNRTAEQKQAPSTDDPEASESRCVMLSDATAVRRQCKRCGKDLTSKLCHQCRKPMYQQRYLELKAKYSGLYAVWVSMRNRCNNVRDKSYHRYGGRGISVCAEWDNIDAFHAWAMQHGFEPGLSIDRINNDGNYEPSNCRFVNHAENNRNRPHTRLTKDIVREIRSRAANGERDYILAKDYGCCSTHIYCIRLRKTWKDVE